MKKSHIVFLTVLLALLSIVMTEMTMRSDEDEENPVVAMRYTAQPQNANSSSSMLKGHR